MAHVAKEEYDEAEKAFREALQHDLRFAAAHNNLGLVLLMRGDLYEAAVELRIVAKLEQGSAKPSANLEYLRQSVSKTNQKVITFRERDDYGESTLALSVPARF